MILCYVTHSVFNIFLVNTNRKANETAHPVLNLNTNLQYKIIHGQIYGDRYIFTIFIFHYFR
jgi:hypothetical protein